MTEDKTWAEMSPDERLEQNMRVIIHEMETPMRGHDADGECCRLAALGKSGV